MRRPPVLFQIEERLPAPAVFQYLEYLVLRERFHLGLPGVGIWFVTVRPVRGTTGSRLLSLIRDLSFRDRTRIRVLCLGARHFRAPGLCLILPAIST